MPTAPSSSPHAIAANEVRLGGPATLTEGADSPETGQPGRPDLAADVRLLTAVADPIRLGIVRQLADCGSVCVCDLEACRWVSQPTVSHHLRVLREAGIVRAERRGTWIYYSLDPTGIDRLAAVVRSILPASWSPGSGGIADAWSPDGRPKQRLPVVRPRTAEPPSAGETAPDRV